MEKVKIMSKGITTRAFPKFLLEFQERVLDGFRLSEDMNTNKEHFPRLISNRMSVTLVKGENEDNSLSDIEILEDCKTSEQIKEWASAKGIEIPSNLKNPTARKNFLKEVFESEEYKNKAEEKQEADAEGSDNPFSEAEDNEEEGSE
jgi:hypothetical protein